MASTLLELARNNHETAELCEQAITVLLDKKPQGLKAKTWHQHEMSILLDFISKTNKELDVIYEDKDGLMKEEVQSMRGTNIFSSFYETLKSTREYHNKFPNLQDAGQARLPDIEVNVNFSGEEIYGKYLDLHPFYLRYCNLPHISARDQDYLQYLDKFNTFFYIPEGCKLTKAYTNYIKDLWHYLSDFFLRVQPLIDLSENISEWQKMFEERWNSGNIPGSKPNKTSNNSAPQPLRLGMFNSIEELEVLGSERLKQALEAMGLKCGGTVSERAARLWSVRGKKPEDIPMKLKTKDAVNNKSKREGEDYEDSRMQLAWMEWRLEALTAVMSDVVSATRRHSEKQQSRSIEEKEAEVMEEELGTLPELGEDEEDNDEDDGPLYNPLNLPLGWDGKPIPFWLYKLHGLGVEFKCEICGNQSYWGRRAFDRHFQEWRHAHGMRCLGVPNTKHFHDITLIEDVLALYAKIKDTLKTEQFLAEAEEEYEDSEGNVLNRRTYEDLARQGLL
eukprot:gene8834-18296_t